MILVAINIINNSSIGEFKMSTEPCSSECSCPAANRTECATPVKAGQISCTSNYKKLRTAVAPDNSPEVHEKPFYRVANCPSYADNRIVSAG